MEYGGYVDPPSHLNKLGKKKIPDTRPPELRTVPDCDYSLFRYSAVALPWLLLIICSAAVCIGLSFWQGPFGFIRGKNGLRKGIPRNFEINDGTYTEAGLSRSLKGLRAANFVCGITPILFVIFALRANLPPLFTKIICWLAAFVLFSLGCMSSVSFALGLDQVNRIVDCPDLRFDPTQGTNSQPPFSPWWPPMTNCRYRIQISTAAVVADMAQAISAFVVAFLLVYTTLDSNWAWGPGYVPVEKSINQPRAKFPPPSPFTHIAETRRAYVWLATLLCAAFVIIAFILMLKLHELRQRPKMINSRNEVIETSGWQTTNNRFRVSMSGFCIAVCVFSLIDMYMIKRRFVSYLLAIFLFWLFVGFIILFAMDVKQVGDAKNLSCPQQSFNTVPIRCTYYPFYGTCWMDWCTVTLIMFYLIYEFVYRVFATYDTYYFYADSEWLRNHSLFVEQTDREAFDWKRFTMDTGKEYYYSPSLGISTCVRPKNYIEPEGYQVPVQPVYVQQPIATPVTGYAAPPVNL